MINLRCILSKIAHKHFAMDTKVLFNAIEQRTLSSSTSTQTELMKDILKKRFPLAKNVDVVDVSGGCGAMYEVLVESTEFQGLPIVKQHRLITETLKQQIKEMHGLRIHTIVPKQTKT